MSKKYQIKTLNWQEMQFGYDQSLLRKNQKMVILEVSLNLNNNSDIQKAKYVAKEWATRKRIQPRVSCGSVFQAIDKETQTRLGFPSSSAGYIIDKICHGLPPDSWPTGPRFHPLVYSLRRD